MLLKLFVKTFSIYFVSHLQTLICLYVPLSRLRENNNYSKHVIFSAWLSATYGWISKWRLEAVLVVSSV